MQMLQLSQNLQTQMRLKLDKQRLRLAPLEVNSQQSVTQGIVPATNRVVATDADGDG